MIDNQHFIRNSAARLGARNWSSTLRNQYWPYNRKNSSSTEFDATHTELRFGRHFSGGGKNQSLRNLGLPRLLYRLSDDTTNDTDISRRRRRRSRPAGWQPLPRCWRRVSENRLQFARVPLDSNPGELRPATNQFHTASRSAFAARSDSVVGGHPL